jgi:hypothetical protein
MPRAGNHCPAKEMLTTMPKKTIVDLPPAVNADTLVTFRHSPEGDLPPRFQRVVDAAKRARKRVALYDLFKSLKLEKKSAWQDVVFIARQLAKDGILALEGGPTEAPAARVQRVAAEQRRESEPPPTDGEVRPVKPAVPFYVTSKGIASAFGSEAVMGRLRRALMGRTDPRMVKSLVRSGLLAKDKRAAIRVDHNELLMSGALDRMRQIIGGNEPQAA